MAANTEITWTDHTFNPWVGCTKIAPGCDRCYAERINHRFGGNEWDPKIQPRTVADSTWCKPLSWHRQADRFFAEHQRDQLVFCGSMCDVFDNKAPADQRDRLWEIIRSTPRLTWQLLTKRPGNIKRFLPDDWGKGYSNVWLGVTVEDREHGLPRLNILREIPAAVRFLSVEPLLEDIVPFSLDRIHWVIIGGESGPGSRPMKRRWVCGVLAMATFWEVPVFFKQWGGRRSKGSSLLDGQEMKEWPVQYQHAA